ncbi:phage tail protein [Nocardioides sp.]|uniref:phage tail protein n=1 Tax=Nocardioides sp. TaxID=35761 RepID=UPI003564A49A
MSEPFLGELRMMSFSFPPRGWALCDGQILPISQNQSLYSLLGTTYGGDGRTTFGLPDLRGRTAVHAGDGLSLGQKLGSEAVTLTADQVPSHTHTVRASASPGDQPIPSILAGANNLYGPPADLTTIHPQTVGVTGGTAHGNLQPYLVTSWCIALQGLFPSRN